jgi:hypothetical protein
MAPASLPAWIATWQLNAGAPPGPSDVNTSTTLALKQIAERAASEDIRIFGGQTPAMIEGEDLRRMGEVVENMQTKDAEKAQEAVSQCRKLLEGDKRGKLLKMLAHMSTDWTALFHAWEVHHAVSHVDWVG